MMNILNLFALFIAILLPLLMLYVGLDIHDKYRWDRIEERHQRSRFPVGPVYISYGKPAPSKELLQAFEDSITCYCPRS